MDDARAVRGVEGAPATCTMSRASLGSDSGPWSRTCEARSWPSMKRIAMNSEPSCSPAS
jgi:hypothetical protein